MNESEMYQDDEVSLFDLWEKLREGWRWVLGGGLVGILGAGLMLASGSTLYEARVVLQPGKVAGAVIEDVLTVLERLKSPSFLLDVARDLDDQQWVNSLEGGGGSNVLVATVPKTNPSVVEIKIRATTGELARKIADSATAKLINRQDHLVAPILGKIRFDIGVAKERLALIEKDVSLLAKSLSLRGEKDELYSQVSLLTSMKLQKDSELLGLRQSIYSMEISLLHPYTQPAKIIEEVFVSAKPIARKESLVLVLGLVVGLLVGVMLVFIASAFRRERLRKQAHAL